MCYASKAERKKYKVDTNLEMPKWYHESRILNFKPGMTLGQNSGVFIVIGTATPSIRERRGCLKNRLQKYVPNVAYC